MSRSYPWNYRVVIPQETVERLEVESGWSMPKGWTFEGIDALTYAVEKCMTPCHFGVGFGNSAKYPWVEYMFSANKTKAKVLKERLNNFLGVEPIEFSKVDDQWFKDHENE